MRPIKAHSPERNEALPDFGMGGLPPVPAEFRAALLQRLGPLAERSKRISQFLDSLIKTNGSALYKVVDRPVDDTGATLLMLALTDSPRLTLTRDGLSRAECTEVAKLLVQLGADPFRRARDGHMPVLSASFVKDEILAKTVLLHYAEHFPRKLTRSECLWLYVGYCSSTPTGHLSPLLGTTLFPPNESRADEEERKPSSGLSITSLLEEQGKEERTFAVEDEAFLKVMYDLRRRGLLSREEVRTYLNDTYDTDGLLLAHRLAMSPGNNDPFFMLLDLGGAPSILNPSTQSGIGRGGTAVHIAARYGTVEKLAPYLHFLPWSLEAQDREGNTPLLVYLIEAPSDLNFDTVSDLLGEGCEGMVSNREGHSAFDLMARRGEYEMPLSALEQGKEPPTTWGVFSKREIEGIRTLLQSLRDGHKTITSFTRGELRLYLRGDALQTELTRMLPKILTAPHPGMIGMLGFAYDVGLTQPQPLLKRLFSRVTTSISPNAADLLVLLAHPAFEDLSKLEHSAALEELVQGITSLERFFHRGVRRVNDEVVSLWREIGKLGFEFLNFKFDARTYVSPDGRRTSLLEEFGFIRCEISMNAEHGVRADTSTKERGLASFLLRVDEKREIETTRALRTRQGVRYVVESVPKETEIELTRTHVRVYHPSLGELIVRNSSPEGGRMAMLEPAYIMTAQSSAQLKMSKGREPLRSYDAVERTYVPVLEPTLYMGGRLTDAGSSQASELVGIYRTFQKAYRAWIFDNDAVTAYVEDPTAGKRYSVGGVRSPGFSRLLDALDSWSQEGSAKELAFCRPAFPAWGEYVRIALEPEVLKEMRRLSRQDFGSPTLRSSGVFDFIQGGMNSYGDLIVR
jgi:hypothetical protein